jgi:hypothetical protein
MGNGGRAAVHVPLAQMPAAMTGRGGGRAGAGNNGGTAGDGPALHAAGIPVWVAADPKTDDAIETARSRG